MRKIISTFQTANTKETQNLAKRIATQLRGGDILLLKGELGSGKTTFVKGLAQALGIKEQVKSPTFVLMQVHRIRGQELGIRNLVHCDAYRIRNARALEDIGLTDWLGRPDTVVVIEWGERVKTLAKKGLRVWNFDFHYGKNATSRVIQISRS